MKRVGALLFGVFFLAAAWGNAMAAYPDKPIKVIIGYEAGSATDMSARPLLPLVEKDLGQPIMIVNKPGAASSLALREVQAAAPDGYTIGMSCSVNVLKLQGLLPFTHRDFDVLSVPMVSWLMLAVPAKSPFQNAKALVEQAKANPGQIKMTTTSKGAVAWIACRHFERITGARFNLISNPGGVSFAVTQLGGGHADTGFLIYSPAKSQIDAGNIRVLGVSTEKRVPGFDQWPTLKEQGIDMVFNAWAAYVAPKGLPPEVFKKLTAAFAKASGSKEAKEISLKRGDLPTPEYVGENAAKFLDEDAARQRPILEELGVIK
ncbi:MAG: tripartite tricarboxylate transporter substrate binding protein [Thermodesulfobacteriota bacterium]